MNPPRVRRTLPDDAPALVGCFRRCYGDTYANGLFYDDRALALALREERLRSVVAVCSGGEVVGHTGLMVRHRGARVAEAGHTVVDPGYRGQGLLGRLGGGLSDLCRALGVPGYVHYPTTAHEVMQRRSVASGGVEIGVMLGYVPAETDYVAIDRDQGRIAATVVYQPFEPLPVRNVYLPAVYRERLIRLYAACGIPRQVNECRPLEGRAVIRSSIDPRRNVASVRIDRAGVDLEARIEAALDGLPDVAHADVPLDDPCADGAVAELRAAGFLYCGLLPEFAHTDILRMQRLHRQPEAVYAPRLINPGARALVALMNSERR